MSIPIQGIILAAGKSSRFKTDKSKLLYTLCGQEMVVYGIKVLQSHAIPIMLVIGHQKEQIQDCINRYNLPVHFVEQYEQKGTAHALLCSQAEWNTEHLLIMNGDMPLVTPEIIGSLINHHMTTDATITFAVAHNANPALEGYGRVIRNEQTQRVEKIVEDRHFRGDKTIECCVNAGIYLIRTDFVRRAISRLTESLSGEFYLTDLIEYAATQNQKVEIVDVPFDRIRGINTLKELWTAEHIKRSELIGYWMERGVHFSAAHNVYVDVDVEIGANSFIGAGSLLLKGTKIGKNCWIEAFSFISNTVIEDHVKVFPHCVIEDSHVAAHAIVGPFAHVRYNSYLHEKVVVGNFVEVARSEIGKGSKVKHLSYIGDAQLGSRVNVGAGTITCNYDGHKKHTTTICDGAFIGSNNSLVAPVIIGEGAITAAGSAITEDVPANALALARARQVTKENYVQILLEKNKEKIRETKESLNPFAGALKADTTSFVSEE